MVTSGCGEESEKRDLEKRKRGVCGQLEWTGGARCEDGFPEGGDEGCHGCQRVSIVEVMLRSLGVGCGGGRKIDEKG